jgi:hypothetical protein
MSSYQQKIPTRKAKLSSFLKVVGRSFIYHILADLRVSSFFWAKS